MFSKQLQAIVLPFAAIGMMASTYTLPANAARVCKVADPTGSPLNIRATPGGRVVGTIRNGRTVSISGSATDSQGRSWVFIGRGWVLREFVACFDR
jgi:uncharacterized protein YraI